MDFLSMLSPMPTPEQMRQWDKAAIDAGMPEAMLMENAAREINAVLEKLEILQSGQTVWLFMGGGNNGGDAAAMARQLIEKGNVPVVFHTHSLDDLKGASAFHASMAKAAGTRFVRINLSSSAKPDLQGLFDLAFAASPEPPALIIDGLLGTGFKGFLRPAWESLIASINSLSKYLDCPVCAIDAPSGLDCMTGKVSPVAIRAAITVALAAVKPGLMLPGANEWTGKVYCRKIGIFNASNCPCDYFLLDASAFSISQKYLNDTYKNSYGHVFVLGGSQGLEGAPHLACMSALRSGAGLVTACAPAGILANIKAGQPEIMTFPVSEGSFWPALPENDVLEKLSKATALVVGPGMGRSNEAGAFLKALLEMPDRPAAVFDADSLVLLGQNPYLFEYITEKDIFTPHPGEAGALLACSGRDIQKDRFEALKKLTALAKAVIVLKGAGTIISRRGEKKLICPYDIPQMAIGGAGDVLAGCMGAMLAFAALQNEDSLTVAGRAVISHALAGMISAANFPFRGAMASDLLNALPEVAEFLVWRKKQKKIEGSLPWPTFPFTD